MTIDADALRRSVDMPNLLLSYGIELRKQGQGYICKCFAHDDHNPSMSVYRDDNDVWKAHCHACGYHDDAIGVVSYQEGVEFVEACNRLGADEAGGMRYARIQNEPPIFKPDRTFLVPPPDNRPPFERANYKDEDEVWKPLGAPVWVGCYRTPTGEPWYYEARYERISADGEIIKEPRCWTWGKRGEQPARWEMVFPPKPRPLYGLDELAEAAQVLVCEGPRKAEAARKMLNGTKQVACVGWAGGANGVKHADWSALAGKPLILLPDADDPGIKAMHDVASRVGAESIHIIDVADMPSGWDCKDAEVDGWDKQQFLAFLKERKREYVAPEPDQVVNEPLTTEMPELDSPPIDAYVDNTSYAHRVELTYENDENYTWPEPLDIFRGILAPKVKCEQLPESIADWCFDTAGIVGVDPTMLAMPAIVAAASMLHDGIQIQPEANNPSWRESARLWGALVGEPSSKKSPAIARALSIVKKIDSECNERESKLKYEYSLLEKAHKTQEAEYVAKLAKGDKTAPAPAKPEMPEIPRAIAQDFTIESLRDILKHTGRGILAERDELSGWFGSMDAYKQGKGGSDRAAWLETYNGGSRRIERVGAGSIWVKNWSACIIGGIQPEPMRAIAGNMHEDGLLQRFMVVYGREGKQGNEHVPDKHAGDRYKAVMRQLWDTQPSPDTVKLSTGANEVRKEIVSYAYKLIGMKFISTALTSHLGKWEGLSARLLLIYHAIDCADQHIHPQSCDVSRETAERVKMYMLDHLLPHAIAFYTDVVGGSEMTKQVNAVANLILARNQGEISLRDITHGWIGWRHISEQLQCAVINRLIDAGWIIVAPAARTNVKRNIATRYLVNPLLHEAHAERAEAERQRRADAKAIIDAIHDK